VRNCCLDDDEICLGCFRSLDEITKWGGSDARARKTILLNAQERRQESDRSRHGGFSATSRNSRLVP